MKSRFFANISHELRTPLTLTEGPVKQMLNGECTGNIKEQYKMILRNSGRLLRLINQLLDLSKLESGKLKLQARATEIISLTNELVQAFESLAVRKQITLKFESELDSQEVYIDIDKYEKIINNLLSNAFKFTPENGEISVDIKSVIPAKAGIQKIHLLKESKKENWIPHQVRDDISGTDALNNQYPTSNIQYYDADLVEIRVSNTGSGIPADRMNKIFERFYQIDGSYTMDGEGTGIGLALTKEFVELHHGRINVQCTSTGEHQPIPPSTEGGTCGDVLSKENISLTAFTLILPLGRDHLKKDEIIEVSSDADSNIDQPSVATLESTMAYPETSTENRVSSAERRVPSILIVEDNTDLREYIRNSMQNDYTIIEAENGLKGLEKAKEEIPDLIISDVMMPKMDGFEFCSEIKLNDCTSHIPVILITARAELEDKIEGLETGADDYITKPFDNKELNVRVLNLIEQRRRLRQKFGQSGFLNPNDVAVTSNDTIFLERAIDLINKNMTDSEFSVEQFAYNIGLSRMQLHRKLKALTDYSTSEFIRVVRLHRAAALLKHKKATVSEIAFEVGFNNLSYFARSFRKHFGKSPSSYSASQNKNHPQM
jgi:signal transduction histidine kinase/DNA-binding response OmpR family regulator